MKYKNSIVSVAIILPPDLAHIKCGAYNTTSFEEIVN